jgi:hypothetical protein
VNFPSFDHGPATDVVGVLVAALIGWSAKRACWMRSVDIKLAEFGTKMDLVLKHLGLL